MSGFKWWRRVSMLLLVAVGFSFCNKNVAQPTTALELEIAGGFAYVLAPPADRKVEVAYLRSIDAPGCSVPQIGTALNVIAGTIVEPANNPAGNTTFDVGGAVITIDNTQPPTGAIAPPLGPHPPNPNRPQPHTDPAKWNDLKWVPNVSPDHASSTLNPGWRSMVDGRMVLIGGTLTGFEPSKIGARDAMWEFRNPDGDPPYQQAITDRTLYRARVNGNTVALTLGGARSGVTHIVVKPSTPGQPVQLQLLGKHDPNAPPLTVGDPIHHFCAFYQLMQPVPAAGKQYLPFYLGDPASPQQIGGGRGSPGFYCPGDFF